MAASGISVRVQMREEIYGSALEMSLKNFLLVCRIGNHMNFSYDLLRMEFYMKISIKSNSTKFSFFVSIITIMSST
jgi:hypothetical protein